MNLVRIGTHPEVVMVNKRLRVLPRAILQVATIRVLILPWLYQEMILIPTEEILCGLTLHHRGMMTIGIQTEGILCGQIRNLETMIVTITNRKEIVEIQSNQTLSQEAMTTMTETPVEWIGKHRDPWKRRGGQHEKITMVDPRTKLLLGLSNDHRLRERIQSWEIRRSWTLVIDTIDNQRARQVEVRFFACRMTTMHIPRHNMQETDRFLTMKGIVA